MKPCFGRDYGPLRRCGICRDSSACRMYTEAFSGLRSLSEQVAEAEAAFLHPPETFLEAYKRMFVQFFGRVPHGLNAPRNAKALARAKALCDERGIPYWVWISAQMHCMLPWLNSSLTPGARVGFQPRMLAGSGAERRYKGYVEYRHKVYRNVSAVPPSETEEGLLLAILQGAEESYGSAIVNDLPVPDMPLTWRAVIDGDKEHSAFMHYALIRDKMGPERLSLLRRLVQLRAAFSVVEKVKHGLPDLIGVAPFERFDWPFMRDFLRRLFPPKRKEAVSLSFADGYVWNGRR